VSDIMEIRKMFGEEFEVKKFVQMLSTIEVRGEKLYKQLAELQKDQKVKDVFNELAAEEKQHVKDFLRLSQVLEKEITPGPSCSLENRDYLYGIIDSHVLFRTDPEKDSVIGPSFIGINLSGSLSVREALELALRFERDSIITFQEVSEYVCDEGRAILQAVTDQEKGHIRKIMRQFKEM